MKSKNFEKLIREKRDQKIHQMSKRYGVDYLAIYFGLSKGLISTIIAKQETRVKGEKDKSIK